MILRPGSHGIVAHTMFYVDEIRFEGEFRTHTEEVGANELQLAKTFLGAIEAPFVPEEFKDDYREELQAMIAKKMSAAGAAPAVEEPARTAPVADILDALKQSIAAARKPPGRVTALRNKPQSRMAR